MSYFSQTLSRLTKDRTHAEIAAASGIPRGTVSFYASGDRGISVSALGQLLQAFPDEEDRLDLVRAHLRDEIPAEVFAAIDIRTKTTGTFREGPPAPPWKKDIDRAIEALRSKAENDEDVRRLIMDLEKVL